jgi:hypothetical protein
MRYHYQKNWEGKEQQQPRAAVKTLYHENHVILA